jgi:hypothetical protein
MSSPAVVPDQAPDASAAMASQPMPQGVADVAQNAQAQAAAPQQAKPSLWKSVVQGALMGLANSGGATSFGAGLAAGAAGPIKQANRNQEMGLQQQQQSNANMAAADAHQHAQVQTAVAQANLAELQHTLAMQPPDRQQAFLEDRIKQAQTLRTSGAQVPVGDTGEYHDVLDRITKLHQTDPAKLFTPEPVRGADGGITWQVYESTDAPIAEDASVDIGGGQTVKFPKGSITGKQLTAYQLQAANQALSNQSAASQAKMKTANAAETRAGAAVTAANAKAAGAANKADVLMFGSMPDGTQVAGTVDDLKGAGAGSIAKLPGDESKKVAVARELISPSGLFNAVAQDISTLDKAGKLGVAATRWNDFMAGKVGSEPEFAKLRTDAGLLATALMQAHVGARGSHEMLEHFKNLADYRISDAATLKSAFGQEWNYVHTKALLIPKK